MHPAAGHYFSISGYSKFCCFIRNIYMIRKSATGVIVALAVIWGGGTWYTGTQIQPGVEKFIKDFNDAKKKGEHACDMTLSYKNFDKGFLILIFKCK